MKVLFTLFIYFFMMQVAVGQEIPLPPPLPEFVEEIDCIRLGGSHEPRFIVCIEPFRVVESAPSFLECKDLPTLSDKEKQNCTNKKLAEFIHKNLNYRIDCYTSSHVVVAFIIKEDGSVADVKIKKGLCNKCNKKILNTVNNMPQWTPGKQRGRNVAVQYYLPIKLKFGLQ